MPLYTKGNPSCRTTKRNYYTWQFSTSPSPSVAKCYSTNNFRKAELDIQTKTKDEDFSEDSKKLAESIKEAVAEEI